MYYGVQRSFAVNSLWEIEFWSKIEKEHTLIPQEAPNLTSEQIANLKKFYESFCHLERKASEWQKKLIGIPESQYPVLTSEEKKALDALIRDAYHVTTQFLLLLEALGKADNDQVALLLGHLQAETLYFIRILQHIKYYFQID